jgi:hypothetical protein
MPDTEYSPRTQDETAPISRRDVWLTIALAIARDGLPTPTEQKTITAYSGQPMLVLDVEHRSDAAAWAAYLGIEIRDWHETAECLSTWGYFRGWRTNVRCTAADPSPIAAELVAAIGADR